MLNLSDFILILITAGTIQGFLLGGYLIFLRKNNDTANRILGVLLISFSYVSIINVFLYNKFLLKVPHLAFTQSIIAFFIAPTYCFYLIALNKKNFKLKFKHALHLLPLLLFLSYTITFYLSSSVEKIVALNKIYSANSELSTTPFDKRLFYFAICMQWGFYSYLIINMIVKIRRSSSKKLSLPFKVFVAYWFIILFLMMGRILLTYDLKSSIYLPVIITFGMYIVTFWGINHEGGFQIDLNKKKKYNKANLSNELRKSLSQELLESIKKESIYKDPNLTAGKLAALISVSNHKLSQILNEELGMSFHALINKFRIDKAKDLLKDKAYLHFSIEGIGKECGFKSKASFYRAFKKFTGKTPSEFKNN